MSLFEINGSKILVSVLYTSGCTVGPRIERQEQTADLFAMAMTGGLGQSGTEILAAGDLKCCFVFVNKSFNLFDFSAF